MFDIGWSELLVIAVVALVAIGPKELPGVLRMVGQWMGKARRMAAEFQGQFQEAMREAEMADLKKSFDEVKEAARGFSGGNIMTSLQQNVSNSLQVGDIDKPVTSTTETAAIAETPAVSSEPPVTPEISGENPATPPSETLAEAETHAASEPLVITPDVSPQPTPDVASDDATRDAVIKDARAS